MATRMTINLMTMIICSPLRDSTVLYRMGSGYIGAYLRSSGIYRQFLAPFMGIKRGGMGQYEKRREEKRITTLSTGISES